MKFSVKILQNQITPEDLKPKTPGSAGIDLMAASFSIDGECWVDSFFIQPGEVAMIGTGIAIHIKDPNYAGFVLPRSSMGKAGLVLANTIGLIDSDYQGEILLAVRNVSNEVQRIKRMNRIAQLIFVPILVPEFEVVENFSESERGVGGFGSTGISDFGLPGESVGSV